MSGIKKALAVILALMMLTAVGVVAASAAAVSDDEDVGAGNNTPTDIVIHVRQDGLAQPRLYLWNSLPTNSAMSKSYPGEKMVSSGKWFNYVVKSITKVNVIVTDADGKQYSKEQKITNASGEWYFSIAA